MEDSDKKKKAAAKRIRVSFSSSLVIEERKPTDTYIKALKEIGLMRIIKLNGYTVDGLPLIVKKKDSRKQLRNIDGSWYVSTHMCTDAKKRLIERIAKELKVKLTVEYIELESTEM